MKLKFIPEKFKPLHKVGFPLYYSGDGKAHYVSGALVSIDETNHKALIEHSGELHKVSIGNVRDFDHVEKAQRAVNAHAELVAALEKAQAWIRQYKACVLALPIAPVDDAINAALAKLNT